MQKISRFFAGDGKDIAFRILKAAAEAAELKEATEENCGDVFIGFYVSEQYFYRTNSVASLSLLLIVEDGGVKMTAVAAGSATGVFGIDLGSAKSLIRQLINNLEAQGLTCGPED